MITRYSIVIYCLPPKIIKREPGPFSKSAGPTSKDNNFRRNPEKKKRFRLSIREIKGKAFQ